MKHHSNIKKLYVIFKNISIGSIWLIKIVNKFLTSHGIFSNIDRANLGSMVGKKLSPGVYIVKPTAAAPFKMLVGFNR